MPKELPTVTVIMPAYNAGTTIGASIRSVLVQEYQSLELIVVNDGSTDATEEVVKSFKDPRIKYMYQRNPGYGSAASPRNLALSHANSKYVAFLDADDLWFPNKLKEQVEHFETLDKDVGLVYSDFCIFETSPDIYRHSKNRHPFLFNSDFYNLIVSNFISLPTAIVRTNALEEVGKFRTDLKGLEDWDLWLRISQKYSMSHLSKRHALYRISPHSMSGNRLSYGELERNYIKSFTRSNIGIPSKVDTTSRLYNELRMLALYIKNIRYKKAAFSLMKCIQLTTKDYQIAKRVYIHLWKSVTLNRKDMQSKK